MAQITTTFYSEHLAREVSVTVIIPTSTERKKANQTSDTLKKTIYLLHGWTGSHLDWLTKANIYAYAIEYDLAFILPSGENSFYIDHPNGNHYGKFIGEELVEITRELFPLSPKREDTWIAGLSMGGYGALRNGLYYEKTFSKIAAFSSRILSRTEAPKREKMDQTPINQRLTTIIQSNTMADLPEENDPYRLALKRNTVRDIFLACGLDDALHKENKEFHQFLKANNIPHEFVEALGGHTWAYWQKTIEKAIEWFVH